MWIKGKTSEMGIYFGTEVINLTEVNKAKGMGFNLSIPFPRIVISGSEQKVPDETKIVMSLKGEFLRNNISLKNTNITLAGEDLIIRTFDLPIFLSKKELEYNAIAFEAKKYVPFKIKELVFDFRLYADRKNKKILVLFVGIRKQLLDRYLSIFKQLEVKVKLIEFAGLSLLRLLRLVDLKEAGTFGLLSVDLEEETNFIICQNGFPLFCRDITLIPKSETASSEREFVLGSAETLSPTATLILMEKLKSEMRISLDFYRRKFPTKPLDTIIVLSSPEFESEITALIKELGLSVTLLNTSKLFSKNVVFSCALAKSYATGMSNAVRLQFPINLLRPVVKTGLLAKLPIQGLPIGITTMKINPKLVSLAFLLIISSQGWGWYKRWPLENELELIKNSQLGITDDSLAKQMQSLEAISSLEEEFNHKVSVMDGIVRERFYFTEVMNIIPRIMPKGAWLTAVSFQPGQNRLELTLEGVVLSEDTDKDFKAVNDIISGFKNSPEFRRHFREIKVAYMDRKISRELEVNVTEFAILCY